MLLVNSSQTVIEVGKFTSDAAICNMEIKVCEHPFPVSIVASLSWSSLMHPMTCPVCVTTVSECQRELSHTFTTVISPTHHTVSHSTALASVLVQNLISAV